MNEKECLGKFMADIDRIITGEQITLAEYEHYDAEHKELLSLARLLVRVDYAKENRGAKERIWSKLYNSTELADIDLDMVAGGVNLNGVEERLNKKNGN